MTVFVIAMYYIFLEPTDPALRRVCPQGGGGKQAQDLGKHQQAMEKANRSNYHHYNKKLKNFARANRQNMTKSEACLWKYLLSKGQMRGYTFKRQRPVLNYIADFMCEELKLIIEVDGITHLNKEVELKDKDRDQKLLLSGFTTLRFSSEDVLKRLGVVKGIIIDWIDAKDMFNISKTP